MELLVERVAAGGDGVAHLDGRVVFVPRAFPGDRVRARLVGGKQSFARAAVLEVLQPSVERAAAPCKHSECCGGCAWMGWDVAAQRRAKLELLADQLRRLGRVAEWPEIGLVAGDDLGWRSRAEWLVGAWRTGAVVGYRARGGNDLVEIDECPVLVPALRDHLRDVKSGAVAFRREARSLQVCLDEPAGSPPAAACSAQTNDGEALEARDDDRRVRRRVAGLDLEFPLRGFQQGNAQLLPRLVELAIGDLPEGDVADLYCGSGLFSLPLAAQGRSVHGVEADAGAVRAARINALRLGLESTRFTHGDVRAWLARQARLPDAVVVDPPRAGLGAEVVAELVRLRPAHVRYVSCDPATLARDAGELLRAGWRCTRADLVDMFPHTPHMETVLRLERSP